MKKLRKGDEVIMIAGKDKGRRGIISKMVGDDRVVVENINMVTHYQRPNPNEGIEGGLLKREASVHISNVALYNHATRKGDRVGIRQLEDGTKVRFFKSNNEVVDI
jgi:large subunit ribosomal protein L24